MDLLAAHIKFCRFWPKYFNGVLRGLTVRQPLASEPALLPAINDVYMLLTLAVDARCPADNSDVWTSDARCDRVSRASCPVLAATFPCVIVLLCKKFPSLDARIGGHWSVLVRLREQVNFHQGRAYTILAVRISEVTMGGFNGAWFDRHGIRPSCLGFGGPPLLGPGVPPSRSVSHLYPLLTLMKGVLRCLQTQWLVSGVGLGH